MGGAVLVLFWGVIALIGAMAATSFLLAFGGKI